jgi:hypothetical protein
MAKDIHWSSGTTWSKADPKKAERIQREVEETARTGSYSVRGRSSSSDKSGVTTVKKQK